MGRHSTAKYSERFVADIFKEVDEDLRRDQANQLWKKYGRYAIGVAVAIVLAVAGFQFWQKYQTEQRMARADLLAAAVDLLEEGQDVAAKERFNELAQTDDGFGVLAAFNEARLHAESGETKAAIALWDRVAETSKAGKALQGAALLLSVMHQVDEGDPAALEGRLAPLLAPGSGYRAVALELTAALALRQGDTARARETYAQIADDLEAPVGLRGRASQMLNALEE